MSKDGKLNIYAHISENSGVGLYRQYIPLETLKESGFANVWISDFRWGEGNHVEPTLPQIFKLIVDLDLDLIVVGRKDHPQFYACWGGIREFFNIPIIMDTDDNVRYVRPFNPGYEGYYPGSDAIVWNKYAINKIFDAITVSTENLKEFHEKENPKIFILPNNIKLKEWDKHEKVKKNDGYIRFGFIGSAAHGEGINIIKKAVYDIMLKYPQTKFVITHIYKNNFIDFSDDLQKRIEYIPWFKLEEWPKGLKSIGLDIGLAPLADNLFNRAKSNLRWLEYSAAKIPTIASSVKPYLCIKNRKNGIIVKEPYEWFNAIEELILNEQLRDSIANEAYKTISEEYDIDKNVKLWDNVYREVHNKFHKFFGPKKHFIKLDKGKNKGKYKQINI